MPKLAPLLVTLALLVTGCSAVMTPYPVGEPLEGDDLGIVNGVWKIGDDVWNVRWIGGGRIAFAKVDHEGDGFKLEQGKAVLTQHGEMYFINFESPDADQPDEMRYTVMRMHGTSERTVVLWAFNKDTFKQAVEDGKLEGEIDSDNVKIDSPEPQFLAFLDAHAAADLFDLENPGICEKVAD